MGHHVSLSSSFGYLLCRYAQISTCIPEIRNQRRHDVLFKLSFFRRIAVIFRPVWPLIMFREQYAFCGRKIRPQAFFITPVTSSGWFRPDDMIKHVETFTHHDFNIRCQAMSAEQVKASSWFQYPPELRQTLVQPFQVVCVPFPLIVPAVWLHFEIRRIGNNKVNGVIRQGLDKMQAISVD